MKTKRNGVSRRLMKRRLAAMVLFSVFAILLGIVPQNVGADEYSLPEYNIDTSQYNIRWDTQRRVITVYETYNGKLTQNVVGRCKLWLGLARKKGTNDYILVTREDMTPCSFTSKREKRKCYGLSEYLSIYSTLPTLINFSPENGSQAKDSIGISFGADSGGLNVGLSYSVDRDFLNVLVHSSTDTHKLSVEYDYTIRMLQKNTYLVNQSKQYAMAYFTQKSPYWRPDGSISFTIDYDVRFGYCDSPKAGFSSIYLGAVYRKQQTEIFSFVVPKN